MEVDGILRVIVAGYEARFAGRVEAAYVLGSYAEGTAVPGSDLDVLVVLRGTMTREEAEAARTLAEALGAASPVRLDVVVKGGAELAGLHAVLRQSLRSGSRLVYGEDLRPALPPVDHETYTRAAWDGALHFCLSQLRGITSAAYPLTCPEPEDEFCGYATARVGEWYPPGTRRGTKELVATVSRLAAATVATTSAERAGGKSEAFGLFGRVVGGPWAGFVGDIFEQGKLRWRYRVPEAPSERAALRALCAQMAGFENTAMLIYRGFWERQARCAVEEARRWAEERQRRIVFLDNVSM
jgi:predicted nucleotidyltransferase